LPNYQGNIEWQQAYFKEIITKLTLHEKDELKTKNKAHISRKSDLLCIKTAAGRLKLLFGFNQNLSI